VAADALVLKVREGGRVAGAHALLAARGLVDAIGATLPGASWQRCRTHYAANLMAVTPKASWP
jgi:transposase-like protein